MTPSQICDQSQREELKSRSPPVVARSTAQWGLLMFMKETEISDILVEPFRARTVTLPFNGLPLCMTFPSSSVTSATKAERRSPGRHRSLSSNVLRVCGKSF
ncbi:hypothetical protein B0H12DRAFT_1129929 [Mycena haematopus]|nr:hypothetical protein B0H12DRAFT_1129929 [Mycena haematopus]